VVRCPIRLVQVDLISRLRQSRMVERVGDFMDSGRRGGRAYEDLVFKFVEPCMCARSRFALYVPFSSGIFFRGTVPRFQRTVNIILCLSSMLY
jgi:hypothetical protein